MSNEDVVPRWALKILPSQGSAYIRLRGTSIEKQWTNAKLELLQRSVCIPCNNGWMSRLEYTAKPRLEPMILGQGQELNPTDCKIVAAWAVKTALLLQATDKESVVPADHYRNVTESGTNQEPPAGIQVWLGACDIPHELFHSHTPLRLPPDLSDDGTTDLNAYGSTFALKHLVFQVLWSQLDPPAKRYIGQDLLPILREIWPPRTVQWPPPGILDLDGLTRLSLTWTDMR